MIYFAVLFYTHPQTWKRGRGGSNCVASPNQAREYSPPFYKWSKWPAPNTGLLSILLLRYEHCWKGCLKLNCADGGRERAGDPGQPLMSIRRLAFNKKKIWIDRHLWVRHQLKDFHRSWPRAVDYRGLRMPWGWGGLFDCMPPSLSIFVFQY